MLLLGFLSSAPALGMSLGSIGSSGGPIFAEKFVFPFDQVRVLCVKNPPKMECCPDNIFACVNLESIEWLQECAVWHRTGTGRSLTGKSGGNFVVYF